MVFLLVSNNFWGQTRGITNISNKDTTLVSTFKHFVLLFGLVLTIFTTALDEANRDVDIVFGFA